MAAFICLWTFRGKALFYLRLADFGYRNRSDLMIPADKGFIRLIPLVWRKIDDLNVVTNPH
jgi:hypothetical protein